MRNVTIATLAILALQGCTWVKLDDAAQRVRVAYDGGTSACRALGEIGVSVKAKVGPYERNALKVRDELESLARNEAVGLRADTIAPLSQPQDGEQRYAAFACAGRATPAPASEKTQTFPIKDH